MIGLPNPWLALAAAAAIAAAGTGGYFHGKNVAAGEHAEEQAEALGKAIAERDAKQRRIDQLERGAAQREQQRQTIVREVYREIPTIVRDPVYRNQCISDDGVRALDRARAAASGVHAGAPAGEAGAGPRDPAHDGSGDRQSDDQR